MDIAGHAGEIAIIGMSCRVSGASNPIEFWRLISQEQSSVSGNSAYERRLSRVASGSDPQALAFGACLEDALGFDAAFFGISGSEAEHMDPQQRLALELAWAALEDAGIIPDDIAGSSVGLFVGAMRDDFAALMSSNPAAPTARTALGSLRSVIAGRISHFFGFSGPSLVVDTGQSSSLAAISLAMDSLRKGDCELALAGGVHLNLDPYAARSLAELGVLSPDGICRPFDERANGYVRGEGGGFVVLKRLSSAVQQNDRIYCQLLGGAVVNEGVRPGLITPDVEAHTSLLRAALAAASVDPSVVGYVETHGTGTPAGDAAEVESIISTYCGPDSRESAPLIIGSVKPNVGHLEAAAGVIGVIRAALALKHGVLPPTLNFESPNAALAPFVSRVQVLAHASQWTQGPFPRTAAVSSFGISGTNAHLILRQALPAPASSAAQDLPVGDGSSVSSDIPLRLWPVSARTPTALAAYADRFCQFLAHHHEVDLTDLAYSLATTRTQHPYRAVLSAAALSENPRRDLLAGLEALSSNAFHPYLVQHQVSPHDTKVVFVFPGQGAQYPAMGAALYQQHSVFAAAVDACDQALSPITDWSVREVITTQPGAAGLDRVDVIQPVLFTVMVSLAQTLISYGVTPDVVIGHSQGEIAAAYIAGVLSLDDAAKVVALRSRALLQLSGAGAMASVLLPAEQVQTRLRPWAGRLSVAAINGPTQTVISGAPEAVEQFIANCQDDNIQIRPLAVDYASHGAQVESLREQLSAEFAGLSPQLGHIPLYSTVEGALSADPLDTTTMDADYWYRNLRQPVRLADTVAALLATGEHTFVELSAHPVLAPAISDTVIAHERSGSTVITTLHRDQPDVDALTTAVARLHSLGHRLDWRALYPRGRSIELPTYPFQHRRYWHTAHPLPAEIASAQPDTTDERTTIAISAALTTQLAGQTLDQQRATVTTLVLTATAAVLARSDPTAINPTTAFKDLGVDSVVALDLRDALTQHSGMTLPSTLVFDHPTPTALAGYLLNRLTDTADTSIPVRALAAPAVDDPVVVVGMACRFPGGVDSPAAMWEAVSSGADAIGGFPTDRGWNLAELFDPDPEAVGKTYTSHGAFLPNAADFDAEFFGISAREAPAIDPQQRLLLEVCWEALETAGIDPAGLAGTDAGVFAGTWTQPYGDANSDGADGYALTGGATSVASGRVAYALGLQGPAITVDTACSSSLVAIHLACQSLRSGESSVALAGGVTVMTTPVIFTEFARQRGLAADGRCKAFAAAADGTGWGEGAGVVVLERLSDARRHHHPVLAVIAGSAVNQDGASNGLTAPNGLAQQRVIRQAVANAGIELDQVDVVEAHGTGTRLGDPIEAGALIATYGAHHNPYHPLWLGSIKSNLGHTQAAAGIAGLIKMITALQHDVLPPTLHVDQPSPHVDWSAGNVRLLTEPIDWPITDHPKTAAVSSFGISGTNAHVIVQQPPTPPPLPAATPKEEPPLRIWPISARTPAALAAQAERLHHHLSEHPDTDLTQVAYSLATTRTHHPYRAAITTATTDDARTQLLAGLHALHTGTPHPNLTQHHLTHQAGKLVFVLPGQGAQYPAMGADLYQHHRVFADAFDRVCAAFDAHLEMPLGDVVFADPDSPLAELLTQTAYAQPALFAFGVAMHAVFTQVGICPDVLVGHSIGELTAAYLAEVFSLEDAAILISARGRLMQACAPGAMLAVQTSPDDLATLLADYPDSAIAAINSPTSIVVAGPFADIDQLREQCSSQGYKTTPLAVSHAFHSPAMDPALAEFEAVAAGLDLGPPRLPVVSNLTGQLASTDQLNSPNYWAQHLRHTVRFADGVAGLLATGDHTFLELSPHPALAPALSETGAGSVIASVRRDRSSLDSLGAAIARLHTCGHSPTWSALYPDTPTVALPTYPFQHRRYWLTPATSADVGAAGLHRVDHPLLGAITTVADQDQTLISGRLSISTQGWLGEHRVGGAVVFPATGFLDLVLYAGGHVGCPGVDELVLHTPLVLVDEHSTDLQLTVHPVSESGRRSVTVHARASGEQHDSSWVLHASGSLSAEQVPVPAPSPVAEVEGIDVAGFYDELAGAGLQYGPRFQGVVGVGRDPADPDTVYAEIALPADTDIAGYTVHPALLDAALHPLLTLDGPISGPRVPFALTGITLHAAAATHLYVRATRTTPDTYTVHATDPTGAPVITISALSLRALPEAPAPTISASTRGSVFSLDWPALPGADFPRADVSPTWALVAADPGQLAFGLRHGLIHPDLGHLDLDHTDVVIWALPFSEAFEHDVLERVHTLTQQVLAQLQCWLARPDSNETPLVILTRHAVATSVHDRAPDLAHAAAWALIHTTQNEHPGRISLIDTSPAGDEGLLITVLAALGHSLSEPQLALRHNSIHTPRLTSATGLTPPPDADWQLGITGKGDLSNLALVPTQRPGLASGQIRVAIRAAGLNFHDVVVAVGAISDVGMGAEAAGVVVEVAEDVSTLCRGDAVMGLFPNNAFAPTAVTDHRMVMPIPAGMSFAQAASVPVAFSTAYIALVELGGLCAGQRVLIHAGAGGVGQAAIQIANHLGAQVFSTAHPNKQHILQDLGVPPGQIASSRTLDFLDAFNEATDRQGVDVVLNSLAGEFVDASLQLLPRGGSFIEIGKTDIRAPGQIAQAYPGVTYQAYDLQRAEPEDLNRAWATLTELFSAGILEPLPTTSYGLLHARDAFRDMSQARHTGKIVLIPPTAWDVEGTVLISGGTGMLGGLLAEHLVTAYGIKHLLLVSRGGAAAAGADELAQRLNALGAHVAITACDTSSPAELAAVLDSIPDTHPLSAVIHAAGVLDDAVVTELTAMQLDSVLAAKADAAWHLHRLTADQDLAAFVLFSSAAATLGNPGQANYAAANAVLDALAHHRHRHLLPATSLAWGYWHTPSGMTAHLQTVDQARVTRTSLTPISTEHGLTLFDTALAHHQPNQVLTPLNPRALDRLARNNTLPPILSALTTTRPHAATATAGTLTAQLATQTPDQQRHTLTALVLTTTAAVLAHPDPASLNPDRPFKDLGIDSLTALELRNTLAPHTGLTLPSTLVFDHPSPTAIADYLLTQLTDTVETSTPVRALAARAVDDLIVVVGMACRFPGGVNSPAALWDVVSSGTDAMGSFPTDRGWNLAELFDPDPDAVGKTYASFGAFLPDAAEFDADFFGISAREAQAIGPQQRNFLEVCWEALETAGIDPAGLVGTNTGVFAGTWTQPYGDPASVGVEGYALTGTAISMASGRVAYHLGLQGPAITVDTACSSSLVATHLACQSLRNGESSLALAGGSTIMTTPFIFTEFARQRGLAADGRCKAFAAAADGTGWGEGAGVVVLERLSDARRHHHPVLAVIAGSAVNQDGASNGLTAPNGLAQQRVIRQAVANAGIELDQVDVVEAHGTGTRLGDPIEAGALIATYGAHHNPYHPLWLGSIKSNLGHTQAAAGIAGLIKMITALQHDVLPPTLHVDQPSPHVDWSAGNVRLLTEPIDWPITDHPKTAAVSSFGISGTNAHVIVQQPPTPPPLPAATPKEEPPLRIWPISARTPAALAAQAERLHHHLSEHPDTDLTQVAYSLATTRTHHPYRAAITTATTDDARTQLLAGLHALHTGTPHPNLTQHHLTHQAGKLVFVLPGQGGQHPAMGTQLYRRHRAFADAIDACDQALRPWTDWSVREVVCHDPAAPSLSRVDVVQPMLFAIAVSLAEVLRGYGIVPDAVIGHSQGEIAAAYIAGALSLEHAAKIVALRSQALAALAGTGAMASVLMPPQDLQPRLHQWGNALSVAAVNGPTHTVISGDPDAMEQFIDTCTRDGIQIRPIAVDYASHSAHVEQLRGQLLHELADLTPDPARIRLYSTVHSALSADPLDTTAMTADYWYRNLREPVRFGDRVAMLLAAGEHTFVELSPHPVLAPAITDILAGIPERTASAVINTSHRDRPDVDTLANALGQLHTQGHSPVWSIVYPQARAVALPTYPFQHRRYWLTPATTADVGAAGLHRPEHPLLGAITTVADQDQTLISGRLSASTQGWLADHRVGGAVVFPATGFLDLVLHAGGQVGCPGVDELVLHTPLVLVDEHSTDVQIAVHPVGETGRRAVTVHARSSVEQHDSTWVLHASASLSAEQIPTPAPWPVGVVEAIDVGSFYDELAGLGLGYGPVFQGVVGVGRDPADPDTVYAEIVLPATTDIAGYTVHPALLDAALHPLVCWDGPDADSAGPRVPFALTGVTLYADAATHLYVRATRTGSDTYTVQASDPCGAPVITISALSLRALPDTPVPTSSAATTRGSVFFLDWPALPADTVAEAAVSPAWGLVAANPDHLAPGLRQAPIYPDLSHPDLGDTDVVIWALPIAESGHDSVAAVHALTREVLTQLQSWLARPEALGTALVVVTRHAVATSVHDRAPDLAHAAAWALIHCTQNEHPGRISLVDTTPTADEGVLISVLAALGHTLTEPQLALRHSSIHIPRLSATTCLTPPAGSDWQLGTTGKGDLSNLALVPTEPIVLAAGQIRVAIRAAGLNFHDVVVAVGAISDVGMGAEAAGVVLEVADDVHSLRRGDAVMGLFPNNAFAPTAVTDHRMVMPIPTGMSFEQAASVPVAFSTAYIALVELGGLRAGQRVLIQAGAGGVGQAAIQIANHLGAQVFSTAHPNKQHILTDLGIAREQIASSRTLEFLDAFTAATDHQGVDVVLNSLAGDFVDASLQLLPRGGAFIEIGKTDIRVADEIADAHPGVTYHAYDLQLAGPQDLHHAWTTLTDLFTTHILAPLPTTSYGLLHAPQAFRDMSQARHTGKIVLIPPTEPDPDGTVLITGGTGMLGGIFAEHLITKHGIKHLLLVSRQGAAAPGAEELAQRLTELGAQVTITACDTSNPTELATLLDSIPTQHRLTAVIHAAGVLDDAVVTELTETQLDTVLAAKADAAWHLHQLTATQDLTAFVLFSSAAATLGNPGQANYAAANAVLDALAHHRHRHQLPATSLAWGYWHTPSGMTAHLQAVDQARVTRTSLTPISTEYGLALFDTALAQHEPNLVLAPLNPRAVDRLARTNTLPPILSALTTTRPHAATTSATASTLATRLASQTPDQQRATVTAVVVSITATVLAHPDPASLNPERPFKDLGIDSLTALELRNALTQHSGLTLPSTLVFDHPTPAALADYLLTQLSDTSEAVIPVRTLAAPAVDDPIVVVGMACRFPGGVDSPAALWDVVSSGTDTMGGFPTDRGWNLAELFDPDPDAIGKTYTNHGAFLPGAAEFDAEFFGISAREAQAIGPQQRLLLEICWEALETAGIDPTELAGTDTGVFAGTWTQPYGDSTSAGVEGYAMTGTATSMASGRVAYHLGLQGPAITVDTACSSSLVATHLACQSLRNGESSLALAGGSTIMTTPFIFTEFARQRGLASDGRCKAFAAAADGTGWGEGAGVIVLERLSDARRHHHQVLAVIAGSAINQDGASNGLTAPNGPAQQRVITQAVANAGIKLDQVDVVEAHGTGTRLGDPIEAGALIATYGAHRDPDHPLWLGSIKSNLGHTQAAAGMAGLIKMITALQHDVLPPTLHVDRPSPHVDWSARTVRLLTEPTSWPVTDHPRTAAVSSFGISGTNAHVIIQQPPAPPPIPATTPKDEPLLRIWPISAHTPAALAAQADRLHQHLSAHPDLDLTEVAYSLATTRTHHPYRAAITTPATDDARTQLLAGLHALHTGTPHPNLTQHHLGQSNGKLVFVLPGQGGQHPAMGLELYTHHRVFARTVDDCDQALRPYTGWSVRDLICQDGAIPSLDRADVVQPVLFTMMVSLAETLRGYGIAPDAVIGHSQGEIAAAYIAGALSLEDAAKIAALRSTTLARLSGTGAMASVLLPAQDLQPRLQDYGQQLSIAAINGPTHTIVSGDPAAMEQFVKTCEHDGIQIRPIAVDYASHSAHVEQLREQLLHELADLTPDPARIRLYSTVQSALSDQPLDTTTMTADYWYHNLRQPVRFHDCVAGLLSQGPHTFLELSPHPVLAPAITDTLAQPGLPTGSAVITTLHRDRPDLDTLTSALAQLHTHGHSPTWTTLYPHTHTTALPTYPFQHHRYWLTPTTGTDVSAAGLDRPDHPLLGAITHLADQDQIVVSGRLTLTTQPWLTGHQVNDQIVFPATGFIELVLHAGHHAHSPVIDELVLHTPLVLSDHAPTDLQITIHPPNDTTQRPFTVHARTNTDHPDTSWTLHATHGLSDYQPHYQGVRALGQHPTNPDLVYAEIALPADTDITGYGIHPALLDAALQPLATLGQSDPTGPRLPFALTGITLHATTATHLHVHLTRTHPDTYTLHASDPTGAPVITVTTVTLRTVPDSL
ncbi:type I polyketide synthase, partial [Mycobacterium szulgai]|uniref:type I polyketide synthase n=1 Tax=Mycobacterium szulgai TaxID=1787 RepID=UPI00146F9AAA